MRLSVVIPCLNAAPTLEVQLAALARQRWSEPWEIIVVDNGSTDGSVEIVRQWMSRLPKLRLVDGSARQSYPFALNVGARAARGEWIAFCDADDEVHDGWVVAMAEALERHEAVAGRLDFETLNKPELARQWAPLQRDGLQMDQNPPYLPHAGGGNFALHRAAYERVGPFDERYATLCDVDYSWRLQLAGYELHFAPRAVIHIRLRDDPAGMYRQARNWGEYRALLYKEYRRRGMPSRRWWRGVAAWGYLVWMLASVRDREAWKTFVWNVGWRVGRLRGSLRYHTLAL